MSSASGAPACGSLPDARPGGERVLILEQAHVGHHLYHARLLVEAVRDRGGVPVIAAPEAVRASTEWDLHLTSVQGVLEVVTVDGRPMPLAALAELAVRSGATSVVVPDGDRLCMQLGHSIGPGRGWPLPRVPVTLLVMRERGQAGGLPGGRLLKTAVKRLLMLSSAARPGVRVAVLRPTSWKGRSPFHDAIDPLTIEATDEDRARARALLDQVRPGARWVGAFGALSLRKNLRTIGEAVLATGDLALGYVLLGHFDEDAVADAKAVVTLLQEAGHPVLLDDRWLTDAELDAFVGVVDCVALAYSNEGPSGLFGKSLASGTFVLAAGSRMLREEARRNPQRSAWTPIDRLAMASVLRRLPPRALADPDVGAASSFTAALLGRVGDR